MENGDKRGLSEVIVSIILVVLVLVAVSIVWVFIRAMLQKNAEEITITQFTNNIKLERANVGLLSAKLTVQRTEGNENITSLKFIFNNGEYVYEQKNDLPKALETKIYFIPLREGIKNIKTISVIPIFGGQTGIETKREISSNDIDYTFATNNGLVGYWKFDNNFLDSSGSANDGNCPQVDCPLYIQDGKVGGAYKFNGVNNYIEVTKMDNLKFIDRNFSISVWINVVAEPTISKNTNIIDTGNIKGYRMQYDTLASNAEFSLADGINVQQRCYSIISPGQWHHLVMVYDYSKSLLTGYVDNNVGCIVTPVNGNNGIQTNLVFGAYFLKNTEYFNGNIDEAMIFDRSLSSDEINQLYLSQK